MGYFNISLPFDSQTFFLNLFEYVCSLILSMFIYSYFVLLFLATERKIG